MAKVVYGPIRAKFKYCPDDSKVKYAEGKCGILEILESEKKNPGNHFALFYFSSEIVNPFENGVNFMTNLYVKTSICTLEKNNKEYTFYRDKGDVYIFEEIEGGVIEDLRTIN